MDNSFNTSATTKRIPEETLWHGPSYFAYIETCPHWRMQGPGLQINYATNLSKLSNGTMLLAAEDIVAFISDYGDWVQNDEWFGEFYDRFIDELQSRELDEDILWCCFDVNVESMYKIG